MAGQPARDVLLAVGDGQRVGAGGLRLELDSQGVEGRELAGRDVAGCETAQRGQQRGAGVAERVHRAGRGGGRVVDLVGQPGREGAQGHQRLALPGDRLEVAGGAEQPLDEVGSEREPVRRPLPQRGGRHPQEPARDRRATGREVGAVVVPGTEPTGPPAGRVHRTEHGLLTAHVPHQVEPALDEHPPEVGRLSFPERLVTGAEAHLLAGREQRAELVVRHPVEQAQRAQVGELHHMVAR